MLLGEDVRDDRYVVTVTDECESAKTMKRACAKWEIMQLTEWRKEPMGAPMSTTVESGGSCEARCDNN